MMHSHFILQLLALTAFASAKRDEFDPLPACPPRPASEEEQRHNFNAFCNEFLVEKNVTKAFTNYIWEDYIQHNPAVGQGRDAAMDYLAAIIPSTNITVVHQGFDQGFGYSHHYNIGADGNPLKLIDVYRINGSCIVEHWDVIANLTETELNGS